MIQGVSSPSISLPGDDRSDTFRAMTDTPRRITRAPIGWLLAGVLTVAACDDPFADFLLNVPDEPTEAVLFDFFTGRLQDPSAFDAIGENIVRVDQTTQWDFLYKVEADIAQLVPFSGVADSASQAGLLLSTETFEEVLEAPETGYQTEEPLDIAVGDVVIVKSRRDRTQILICNQYLKLEVIEIDAVGGTILFRYLRNPNCGDRVLEPGTHGSL